MLNLYIGGTMYLGALTAPEYWVVTLTRTSSDTNREALEADVPRLT